LFRPRPPAFLVTRTAFRNGRVLIGDAILSDRVVVIDGPRIVSIDTDGGRPHGARREYDLAGRTLLPGFVDVQVNGGGGVMFNAEPTVDGIRTIARAHRRFGTTGLLPTLISDDLEVVERAIAAVDAAIDIGVPGVLGVHLEGPYLSTERKGAHDATKLRSLDGSGVARLASLRRGRTLVTMAPEVTTAEVIRALASAGVLVSAGHTNATIDVMRRAFASGVTGVTHLFNAMSPLTSRAPGVVGAALDDPTCRCGIIVDGRHVDPATLRVALRAKPLDRFMLVTDAMPCVGSDSDTFELQGRTIRVKDGVCVDDNGTLSGASIDMATTVRNAMRMLNVTLADAARMASAYPADYLGLGGELGHIRPGLRANLVVVDDDVQVIDTWIDGVNDKET
jgi:N-acetylglucosamine-6-phosphate deacetylase